MKFVRFGSLNLHDNSYSAGGAFEFHHPPVKKGVYAFPLHWVEPYLVEWKYKTTKEMWKDKREFEYNGEIWHHLWDSPSTLARSGCWILDPMEEYKKKLKKRIGWLYYARRCRGYGRVDNDDMEVFIAKKIC